MDRHSSQKLLCILLLLISIVGSYAQQISSNVRVSSGGTNGVFIEKDGRTLVVYGDPKDEIKKADMVLFTHFRRDVIWAGRDLVSKHATAVAPAAQREYFTKGDSIWQEIARDQFRERSNRTTKIGVKPINIARFVRDGETVQWNGLNFQVLNTSGYTRGSVSYIADIDNKRIAFVGDLIYGDGKLFDLYSFQDSLRGGIDGNHGYAARLSDLIKSLQLIAAQRPQILVPSRGPVINDPDAAIQKLLQRIRLLYQNYLSITAQRWNHTDRMIILSNRLLGEPACVDWMPFSTVIQNNPPAWYKHLNCGKIIVADDSSAFLVDCGTKNDLDAAIKLKQAGRIKKVDGIFVTHYHFDHTDFVNQAVKEFGCPVYATKELKGILEKPGDYHMPSMTPDPIPTLTIMNEGQKMSWKDFTLTFLYFPGQTLYHDGLLMEKRNGESIFFTGDSFTPAGIDDYCFQNRNILHEGTGYLYCLDLLRKLPPNTLLANQHIKPLFRFSSQQLDHMTKVLRDRNVIIKDLLPWDDVNYGTDDQWAWVFPYGQKVRAGQTVECVVKIFNYSDVAKTFTITANPPDDFKVKANATSLTIQPHSEGTQAFELQASKKVSPGVAVFTADIKVDNWELKEWTEAFIEIER